MILPQDIKLGKLYVFYIREKYNVVNNNIDEIVHVYYKNIQITVTTRVALNQTASEE